MVWSFFEPWTWQDLLQVAPKSLAPSFVRGLITKLGQSPTMTSGKNGLYVQYGCGLSCPDGWLNFDVSPRLRAESAPVLGSIIRRSGKALFPANVKYGDIVAGLPVPAGSAEGVYCSHVLEHLDRVSVVKALANTFKLLRPGGVFRLVVPDLSWRARIYMEAHECGKPDAADEFMKTTYLGTDKPVSGVVSRLRQMYGNSAHRWMYDFQLMARLLGDAGFVNVRRCKFDDAEDPMFARVEEEGRFYDDRNEELAIEARRSLTT